ncbi:MAG: hypothetical protein Q8Q25_03450 [bacterium]|nr:hypothetical protein [bacterium]
MVIRRFLHYITVILVTLVNGSNAMDNATDSKKWEEVHQQDLERYHGAISPKSEIYLATEKKSSRAKAQKKETFKNAVREKMVRTQQERTKRAANQPRYKKGRKYRELMQQFRSCRYYPKKVNTITTATVMVFLKNKTKDMNTWWFTICVTALYEILKTQKLILKLPFLSDTFKQRLAHAVHGGLYANIVNSVMAPKVSSYFPCIRVRSLNGWKVIGSYLIIDLISNYGWDSLKKPIKESVCDTVTEIAHEEYDNTKRSSPVKTIIDWAIKTILATALPDLVS